MNKQAPQVLIIRSPDQKGQTWITHLAHELGLSILNPGGGSFEGTALINRKHPDIIIVAYELNEAERLIREIFTSMPNTICIALVPDVNPAALRRLVAAGARDILAQPVQSEDLVNSIRAVLRIDADRRLHTANPNPVTRTTYGRLVVVTSPKGGVGKTTIASNIAVGLRRLGAPKVALIDLNRQFGSVDVHLNIRTHHSIIDLMSNLEDIDDALLDTVLIRHGTGIDVLRAPGAPSLAAEITGPKLEIIVNRLLQRYTYVVVDADLAFDEATEALLHRADEIILTTTPEVPALNKARRFLAYLNRHKLITGRLTVALNRFPGSTPIDLENIQSHLGLEIHHTIPSAGLMVTEAINLGIPMVMSQPASEVAISFMKLAAEIMDHRKLKHENRNLVPPVRS